MLAQPLFHLGSLVGSFAILLIAHLTLAFGLVTRRSPRWHAAMVLVPPLAWLAPYWGFRSGMKVRAVVWVLALIAYVITWMLVP